MYTEFLDSFMKSKRIKKVLILPSSIHEAILLFGKDCPDTKELISRVNEVNNTQLAPEEILSDNVYVYDGKELSIL